jgi:hypothetical protein
LVSGCTKFLLLGNGETLSVFPEREPGYRSVNEALGKLPMAARVIQRQPGFLMILSLKCIKIKVCMEKTQEKP